MNQHLVQAIAAARAGKTPQAKVLLARVIKDEPENVNAWYLLSSLADTEEQKIQHLQKVVELQPDHPTAAQQLAELVPPPPEPVVDDLLEMEDDGDTATYPIPDFSEPSEPDSSDVPDDPDEAMAWLERLAADQGARLEELPSLSGKQETADATLEIPVPDIPEKESAPEPEATDGDVPDDPDEAMAWLERLAADQGANLDELPSMFEEDTSDDAEADDDDIFSWLDDDMEEDDDALDVFLEEAEAEDEEAPAPKLTVSEDLDFVSQSKGDSIPAWLAEDEEYIAADTVISQTTAETAEQTEPENLPDWLNEEPAEDWVGDERDKSGQVVWKAGEGDESLKPAPPVAKKETKAAVKQTAQTGSSSNTLLLVVLSIIFVVLLLAILYILVQQPL